MIKTGISGLRGTVAAGESNLTAATVAQWVQAFVGEIQTQRGKARPTIALGHDARLSSPAIAAIAKGALLLAGADVVELGRTLTPTIQLEVRRAQLDGGLMITASHNPIIYNGLKFLDEQGFFLPLTWWDGMEMRLGQTLPAVPLDHIGTVTQRGEEAWQAHLARALAAIDPAMIRAHRFRVALDACNGGAVRWAEFLDACGCETILLHTEQHGYFSREAEPLPQHLTALQQLVRHARCDIGFAADPDGDRLVLVDAHGDAVSEELTVVLVAQALTGGTSPAPVVVNVVTTHAIESAIPAKVVRTAVGEMNVVAGVQANRAVLGGEGSGGIIVPHINMARDGLAAIAMILRLMAQERAPLHDLIAQIPVWRSIKSKLTGSSSPDALRTLFSCWQQQPPTFTLGDTSLEMNNEHGSLHLSGTSNGIYLRVETQTGSQFVAEGGDATLAPLFAALLESTPILDLTDGVKLYSDSAWLSIRPSNTEPIARIMGEIKG